MKPGRVVATSSSMLALVVCMISTCTLAQHAKDKASPVPGPMLSQGIVNYDTPDFTLSLVRSSQTIAALKPKGGDGFDFTPGDLLVARSQDGFFHLGDLPLRLRTEGSTNWETYSTASARTPVTALPASGN